MKEFTSFPDDIGPLHLNADLAAIHFRIQEARPLCTIQPGAGVGIFEQPAQELCQLVAEKWSAATNPDLGMKEAESQIRNALLELNAAFHVDYLNAPETAQPLELTRFELQLYETYGPQLEVILEQMLRWLQDVPIPQTVKQINDLLIESPAYSYCFTHPVARNTVLLILALSADIGTLPDEGDPTNDSEQLSFPDSEEDEDSDDDDFVVGV